MRSALSGTLRKDGRWQITITLTRSDGAKIRKAIYAPSQREVQEKARKLLGLGREAPATMTVCQLYDECKEHRWTELREKTLDVYKWGFSKISPTLGSKRVAEIKTPDVARWLRTLASDPSLSGRSIQIARNVLKLMMGYAVEQGWANSNPCFDVKLPRSASPRERRKLRPAEVQRIIELEPSPWRKLLWLTLEETALRPSEALNLEASDILEHDKSWWISVKKSKTRHGIREVPIADALARSLIESLPFPNKDTSAASKQWVKAMEREWLDRCKKAKESGLPNPPYEPTNLYQLRKFRLSQWRASGMPDEVEKELAGHSSIVLTKDVYIHVDADRLLIAKESFSISTVCQPS